MEDSPKMIEDYSGTADLVCYALCKEIANAKTWGHVTQAWQAILTVRREEKSLVAEQRHLKGPMVTTQGPVEKVLANLEKLAHEGRPMPGEAAKEEGE